MTDKENHIYIMITLFAIAIVVTFLIVNSNINLLSLFSKNNIGKMKDYVLSFGALAPVIFILLQILQSVIAPIPGVVLVIVGGVIWGPYLGGLLSIIGCFFGSIMCFILSRTLGRPFVEKFVRKSDVDLIDRFLIKYGFWAILIMRLIPVLPFDTISYGLGLTKTDIRKFATATLIGMIPGNFIYSYLGFSMFEGKAWFFVAVLSIIIILISASVLRKMLGKKGLSN
jgi:uncharacterized membrane protein YdjX (TVP38/TMEM64 family)